MANTGKLMTVGISLVVLTIVITTVMVPIISANAVPDGMEGSKTINALIRLFPLLLGIGGLLAITSLFTGKK